VKIARRRIAGSSDYQYIKVINDSTFMGWMKCSPDGGGWGNGKGQVQYTLHFYGRFSKPMTNYGFWSADIPDDWERKRDEVISIPYLTRVSQAPIIKGESELEGKHLGFFTEFASKEGEQVTLQVGISYVDAAGAENNFNAEIAGKDFDKVRAEAFQQWNRELGRINIEGGTEEQKTVFYTSLYHTMIDPRIHTDVDGRYIGGDYAIHQTDGKFTKRTVFSGWDVFRSQMPLQTIINPELVSDELNSLITMADQSGREYYERWELFNAYSGCMLGNPAHSVLADAYVKGIRTFDAEKALQYALNTSKKFGNDKLGYSYDGRSRGISLTLEYAYFDWCIAQMAQAMGKSDLAAEFTQKSKAYRNLWDEELGWFRPRLGDGEWDKMRPKGRLQP
jgi:predicted alpha-1,2-mannosidase